MKKQDAQRNLHWLTEARAYLDYITTIERLKFASREEVGTHAAIEALPHQLDVLFRYGTEAEYEETIARIRKLLDGWQREILNWDWNQGLPEYLFDFFYLCRDFGITDPKSLMELYNKIEKLCPDHLPLLVNAISDSLTDAHQLEFWEKKVQAALAASNPNNLQLISSLFWLIINNGDTAAIQRAIKKMGEGEDFDDQDLIVRNLVYTLVWLTMKNKIGWDGVEPANIMQELRNEELKHEVLDQFEEEKQNLWKPKIQFLEFLDRVFPRHQRHRNLVRAHINIHERLWFIFNGDNLEYIKMVVDKMQELEILNLESWFGDKKYTNGTFIAYYAGIGLGLTRAEFDYLFSGAPEGPEKQKLVEHFKNGCEELEERRKRHVKQ